MTAGGVVRCGGAMVGSGGVKRCGGGAISTLDSSVIVGKYTIIKINNNKYALVLGFTTKYSYISRRFSLLLRKARSGGCRGLR
jgi:hypothetical protein